MQFFFSAGQGVNLDNMTLNGVPYTIHSSNWQTRADANSARRDIPGTEHAGGRLLLLAHRARPVPRRGGDEHRRHAKEVFHQERPFRRGEQVDTQPAQQLAPVNQSPSNEAVLNKRIVTDVPNHYIDLTTAGRFRETQGSNVRRGTYTYQNFPETDTGILDFDYGDGDRRSFLLKFASPTAGTVDFACGNRSNRTFGSTNWRLANIP